MTQMHERYAYAAFIFLVLLIPETRPRWLWLAFGVAFTLNLLAAVPPTPAIGERLSVDGSLGIAGSMAMIVDHDHDAVATASGEGDLRRSHRGAALTHGPDEDARGRPPHTNAGSAAATCAA